MGGWSIPTGRPRRRSWGGSVSTFPKGASRCGFWRGRPTYRASRILWLRYCAEPTLSLEAIGDDYGLPARRVSQLAQHGLSLLAHLADEHPADRWDPDSPLGRAVIWWRLQHRPFVPRPRGPGAR
jgi:hypothetical protein